MILYILKTSICFILFLSFYKLLLEKENMHVFKRFYLIASILCAFIIPAIVFTEYVYVDPAPSLQSFTQNFDLPERQTTTIPEKTNYLNTLLWSVYGLGVFLFGFKYFQNLFQIRNRIFKNPKIKKHHIINVLLQENLAPHTFFNFIFLNKQKYDAHEIPAEVLLHEQTHAVQKHSIDVLFIEFLQVIFWFNPLVYAYKKAIKLNHEFLADYAVMQKGIELKRYQKILLAFSSNAQTQEIALSNAINYSSIKKRFTVMKKNTSKKAVWLRSLLVLPLVALALYSFSETKVLEIEKQNQNDTIISNIQNELEYVNQLDIDFDLIAQQKSDSIRYFTKANVPTPNDFEKWKNAAEFALWINGKPVNNKALENYKAADFAHYSSSFVYNNARSERFPQPYQVSLYTQKEFEKQFTINDRAITILINKNEQLLVQNELLQIDELKDYLSKLNTDLTKKERSEKISAIITAPKSVMETALKVNAILTEYGCATINIVGPLWEQKRASKTQLSEYNALAKKYNAQPINKRIIKKIELEKLESIYSVMTSEQKQHAQPFPECPPPPAANQDGATKEQISEYNAIASKYSDLNTKTRIKKSEVDRMTYLYSLMTEKQKREVANFPELPPMPEPPMPPAPPGRQINETGYLNINNEKYFYHTHDGTTDYFNKYGEEVDNTGKIISPVPPKVINGQDTNVPPPPPPPSTPLDHVIVMAKKGAMFYYEDKKISADEAIKLLKKNSKLNIDSRGFNSTKPVVRISKAPITIEN
jgi:bla regulator protein blaR1